MARFRWEARAQQRKEMDAAVWPVTQPSTARIIRPAPSSSDDRSIGDTELTTDAKITSCAAHALRYVRGGMMACLMFSLLVGSRDYANSQATAASQTTPADTAASPTTPANTTPSQTTPAGTTPSQTTPASTAASQTAPASTAASQTAPADTAASPATPTAASQTTPAN